MATKHGTVSRLLLAVFCGTALAACVLMRNRPEAPSVCVAPGMIGAAVTCPAPAGSFPGDRCTCADKATSTLYIGRVRELD